MAVSKKIFFWPFGPHFGLRIRGSLPALDPPLNCTGFVAKSRTTLYLLQQDFATYNNLTFFCKTGTTWQFNSFRRRLSKSPVIFFSWFVILRNLIQARFARFWELMRGWLVASLVLQQLHVSAPPFPTYLESFLASAFKFRPRFQVLFSSSPEKYILP